MCDDLRTDKITYAEYVSKKQEIYTRAHSLLEDISADSSEVYYVETLFRKDAFKRLDVIRYKSGIFKRVSDIMNWIKENAPGEEYRNYVFWRVCRYESAKTLGSHNHCLYVLIFDYYVNKVIDFAGSKLCLDSPKSAVSRPIKSFLNEWEKIMLNRELLLVECPFQIGNIIEIKKPYEAEAHYYVYLGKMPEYRLSYRGSIAPTETEWLLDVQNTITPYSELVRPFLQEYIHYSIKKVQREYADERTAAVSELVVKKDRDFYEKIIYYKKANENYELISAIAEGIETRIKQEVGLEKVIEWNADSEKEFCGFVCEFNDYVGRHKVTLEELKAKIDLLLKQSRDIFFTDCNEREIYFVENIFREDMYAFYEPKIHKWIYKNYKDVNGAILDYSYDFIESYDNNSKMLEDGMYFVIRKCVLNHKNKYTEIYCMKFNAHAELLDITFGDEFKVWCLDSEQMKVYEEWKKINEYVRDTNNLLIENFGYGDILEFDMRPLYAPIRFIFVKDEPTNHCYFHLKYDNELISREINLEYRAEKVFDAVKPTEHCYGFLKCDGGIISEVIDEKYQLGIGVAGHLAHIHKVKTEDCLLNTLSGFLKQHPEANKEILSLFSYERDVGYCVAAEEIYKFMKNYSGRLE